VIFEITRPFQPVSLSKAGQNDCPDFVKSMTGVPGVKFIALQLPGTFRQSHLGAALDLKK
jgi:hypothetical protein